MLRTLGANYMARLIFRLLMGILAFNARMNGAGSSLELCRDLAGMWRVR